MTPARGLAAAACLLLPLSLSCATGTAGREEMLRQAELYAVRASFAWNRLDTFQIRGNCRIDDASLVARGRFVLWGCRSGVLLRGDFYGPDGRPVVSMSCDASGMTLYLPAEESAVFMPQGLATGDATLATLDLIHLIRTGFPLELEPWELAEGMSWENGRLSWKLTAVTGDTLFVTLENGRLFPSSSVWEGGELLVTGASPHDEYAAWPWAWRTVLGGSTIELELTHVDAAAVPWEGIWGMTVPVPIDTLDATPLWEPSWEILRH